MRVLHPRGDLQDAKGDHATVTAITGVQRSGLCLADAGDRLILAVTAGSGFSLVVAVDLSCVLVSSTKMRRNVG